MLAPLCQELLRWLRDGRSDRGARLHALLRRHLEAGPWRHHCQRLLHLLPQQDLLPFAEDLLGACRPPGRSSLGGGGSSSDGAGADGAAHPGASRVAGAGAAAEGAPGRPGAWLVFRSVRWQSLEQLTLAAALGCCLPLLLRLLREEERADELAEVQQAVQRVLPVHQPPAAQAAALAAHWRLREQLRRRQAAPQAGAEAAAAAAIELRELLLLHLFAAAFLADQLCRSGRTGNAAQLQSLLAASGFSCQFAAPTEMGSSRKDRRKERRRSKGSKERKRGKEKRKRKRRRRSDGSGSSDSGSGSSDSEDGLARHCSEAAAALLDWRTEPAAGADSAAAAQPRWRLGTASQGGDSGPVLSSLELLEALTDAAASAHAAWLFS